MNYDKETNGNEYVLRDAGSGYMLLMRDMQGLRAYEGLDVTFRVRGKLPAHTITSRDLDNYDSIGRLRPELQYVEVGPGLGGFLEELVKIGPRRVPVAIDHANYPLMKLMMLEALEDGDASRYHGRLGALVHRCDIMMGDDVRLINMTLGNALLQYPDLQGFADVVVDMAASRVYRLPDENPDDDWVIEKMLASMLRPGGKVVPSD